jgi:hypothetical protein
MRRDVVRRAIKDAKQFFQLVIDDRVFLMLDCPVDSVKEVDHIARVKHHVHKCIVRF